MPKTVEYVGGPLCGSRRGFTAARYVHVPDRSSTRLVLLDDGTTTWMFGMHVYEKKCYVKGSKRKWRLEYVRFAKAGEGVRDG